MVGSERLKFVTYEATNKSSSNERMHNRRNVTCPFIAGQTFLFSSVSYGVPNGVDRPWLGIAATATGKVAVVTTISGLAGILLPCSVLIGSVRWPLVNEEYVLFWVRDIDSLAFCCKLVSKYTAFPPSRILQQSALTAACLPKPHSRSHNPSPNVFLFSPLHLHQIRGRRPLLLVKLLETHTEPRF